MVDKLMEAVAEVAFLAISTFVITIALGAAHSHYAGVPPLSFLTVVWLLVVFRVVAIVAKAPLVTKE